MYNLKNDNHAVDKSNNTQLNNESLSVFVTIKVALKLPEVVSCLAAKIQKTI